MNKKNHRPSIDGFIPRRPGSPLGDLHQREKEAPIDRSLHTGNNVGNVVGIAREQKTIGQADIADSLREIEDIELNETTVVTDKKLSRKEKRRDRRNNKRPKRTSTRIIKWTLLALLIIGILGGGYLALRTILASDHVFNGSIFDLAQTEPLKEDENGRSNFLVVGTSEDDPGHDASYLTDSIIILSVDQDAKNAYMFNIPRDLYVEYGMPCLPGYAGKVNSYFSCVSEEETDEAEQRRLSETQKFIGDIVGMDIQYGVHVNYTVMRDVVNAIGGEITVNIESRDPNGQMDSNFDWKCGDTYAKRLQNCPPNGHFIDYPNGPAVLDAEHALYLAQARGDIAPTYGFEQSNFDRERNQQKIIVAIRDKAMSAGTLTNLGAVTGLIDALGDNLRTNIQTKEVRTIMKLAADIKSEDIQSIDLYKEGEAIFTTQTLPGPGSVVLPAEGQYMYDDLQTYLRKIINSSPIDREAPHVTVMNGGRISGVAQTEADKLAAQGYIIDLVENAPDGEYMAVEIYQVGEGATKTASAAKLEELYGVKVKTTTPPASVVGETDFLIILGPTE